jgi:hypothetical protein
MMSDQEHEGEEGPGDRKLMSWALKNARRGKKVILGSSLKEQSEEDARAERVRAAQEKAHSVRRAPRPPTFEEPPKLEDLKDLAPEANWERRDLLYEAGLIALGERVMGRLLSQDAPRDMVKKVEEVKEAMKVGSPGETRDRLVELMEQWGGYTAGGTTYHFLRAFIRIVLETYPLD